MTTRIFSADDVAHIADLANIPVTAAEKKKLAAGFNSTMKVVDELFKVNVGGIDPTHQVTDLENVMRDDEIDNERQFTQKQALANTDQTYNGFFMVDQVIFQDE